MSASKKKNGNVHEVFITKWALTRGIVKAQAYYDSGGGLSPLWMVKDPWATCFGRTYHVWECFETLEQAQANVDKRVEKRVASLKKQISKLLGFEAKIVDACGKEALE